MGDSIKVEQNSPKTGRGIIGQPFPEITSKSLADRTVTLPKAVKGKVALVFISFIRSAQSMINSWARPSEQEFGKDSMFAVYEIPMINTGWKFLSWMIDSGMRGGIPVEKYDYVVTFYGDYSGYQDALEMEILILPTFSYWIPKVLSAGKRRDTPALRPKKNFSKL